MKEESFSYNMLLLFRNTLNIDLNKYRNESTRRFDSDELLFFNWDFVSKSSRKRIFKFADNHKDQFKLNFLSASLVCLAEVKEGRK